MNIADRISVELGLNANPFKRGLDETSTRLKTFTRDVDRLGGAFRTAISAVSVAGFVAMVQDAASLGDELATAAAQAQIDVEALQKLRYATMEAGLETSTLATQLSKLNYNIAQGANGVGNMAGLVRDYSLQLIDAEGNTRSANEVLYDLSDLIAGTSDHAERARIAVGAFGEEGLKLLPILQGGSQWLRQMGTDAENLGLVIDRDGVASLDRLDKQFKRTMQRARTGFATMAVQADQGFRQMANFGRALLDILGSSSLGIEDLERRFFELERAERRATTQADELAEAHRRTAEAAREAAEARDAAARDLPGVRADLETRNLDQAKFTREELMEMTPGNNALLRRAQAQLRFFAAARERARQIAISGREVDVRGMDGTTSRLQGVGAAAAILNNIARAESNALRGILRSDQFRDFDALEELRAREQSLAFQQGVNIPTPGASRPDVGQTEADRWAALERMFQEGRAVVTIANAN